MMSNEEIIPLETICSYYQLELSFVETLESHGLISISYQENQRYILKEEIVDLEKYSRLYYELNINVPGIDALDHLLARIKQLQQEAEALKARLGLYE